MFFLSQFQVVILIVQVFFKLVDYRQLSVTVYLEKKKLKANSSKIDLQDKMNKEGGIVVFKQLPPSHIESFVLLENHYNELQMKYVQKLNE